MLYFILYVSNQRDWDDYFSVLMMAHVPSSKKVLVVDSTPNALMLGIEVEVTRYLIVGKPPLEIQDETTDLDVKNVPNGK